MSNYLYTIKPYKWNGLWVFDDAAVGLDKEALVAGTDVMIDVATQQKGITNAEDGFVLMFSAGPFPGADFELTWAREEHGGNVYSGTFEVDGKTQEMEGWLCPALFLYFSEAPEKLYTKVLPLK